MAVDVEVSCMLGDLLLEKLKVGSKYKVTYVAHERPFISNPGRHTVTGTLTHIKKASRFYQDTTVRIQKVNVEEEIKASEIIRIQEVS